MRKKYVAVWLALVVSKSFFAQKVQKDTLTVLQPLQEVVVSDSKFELKRENSGKTVIKITAQELERNPGKTLAEIINTKSGIQIAGNYNREGDVLGVFIRGGNKSQTLVIIDGVRVSDPSLPDAEYDLRLLSPAMIESVEIVKGAASTLYGTNAATAVINITTKKSAKKKIVTKVETGIGTYQTAKDQNYNAGSFHNAVFAGGTLNRFTYAATFTNRFKSGLSAAVTPENEEDIFSYANTNIKLGYQFSKAFDIGIYGNHTRFKNDFDHFDFTEAPNRSENDQKRVGLSSVLRYGKGKGAIHLNTAYSVYNTNTKDISGDFLSDSKNVVIDVYNKYVFATQWHTVLGVNYIRDEGRFFTVDSDFTIVDPYANVVYVSDFGLTLNLGGRLNTHSEYGSHGVYSFNPSYVFSRANGYIKLLGSYATSYITPTLSQLFGSFGGNPNLEPEENRTLEGGLEYTITKKARVSAVYFNRNEKNAIGFDSNDFKSSFVNLADKISVNGVEMEAFWQPVEKLTLEANYTFTERKEDNVIRIPKHKANAVLGYQPEPRTYLSLSYAYTGKRLDTDFNTGENLVLDAFSLIHLYASHQVIADTLRIFVNAENLLNEDYVDVLNFTTRGRNFRVGLQLNF